VFEILVGAGGVDEARGRRSSCGSLVRDGLGLVRVVLRDLGRLLLVAGQLLLLRVVDVHCSHGRERATKAIRCVSQAAASLAKKKAVDLDRPAGAGAAGGALGELSLYRDSA
jgi:hypothetical protein